MQTEVPFKDAISDLDMLLGCVSLTAHLLTPTNCGISEAKWSSKSPIMSRKLATCNKKKPNYFLFLPEAAKISLFFLFTSDLTHLHRSSSSVPFVQEHFIMSSSTIVPSA